MEILDTLDDNKTPEYAGFWIRFVAYLIDSIVLGIVLTPLFFLFYAPTAMMSSMQDEPDPALVFSYLSGLMGFIAFEMIIYALYFAGMHSSKYQATLGKMAIGVIVTDKDGNRISMAKGIGRFFAKILSGLIMYIGFIMAGFDSRKQALHDKIADTYVIYKG